MNGQQQNYNIIIDCNYTLEEAVAGLEFPKDILDDLVLVDVKYYSFDNKIHKGQIIVHSELKRDIIEIFDELLKVHFPIEKVIPIVKYNWSDELSMQDNNSSGFNYRFVAGTNRLSNHSNGCAVDINPKQNPQIIEGTASPSGSVYDIKIKGTIDKNSIVVKLFKMKGWNWGGDWKTRTDYQHFEKLIE